MRVNSIIRNPITQLAQHLDEFVCDQTNASAASVAVSTTDTTAAAAAAATQFEDVAVSSVLPE